MRGEGGGGGVEGEGGDREGGARANLSMFLLTP